MKGIPCDELIAYPGRLLLGAHLLREVETV